jgi:hypothetical protein
MTAGTAALACASGAWLTRGAAVAAMLLSLGLAGDRMTSARAGIGLDLPQLMLWAWDRDDDLRFVDVADTGVAFLAATLTLRGEEVPHHVLQVDYEAPASQRAFLIDAIAALRARLPGAAISVTALASWCFNESWTGRLDADEIVPMLFRMGYDGRRLRAHLAGGGDFRGAQCRSSLGVATDELPATLPGGKRVYAFSPRRWTPETYQMVRARISQWSRDQPPD